jgi:hypothetical protein
VIVPGAKTGGGSGRAARRRAFERGKREASRRRRHQLQVTLSGQERRQLGVLATERDVAMARLLVDSALGAQPPLPASPLTRRQYEELLEVLYDVRRRLGIAGNNINQLARMANTTGDLPAEARLSAGLEDVRGAIRVLHDAIDRLPRA